MIEWTRVRLGQWGRWCRGGMQTGYPSRSAFVRAGEGARGDDVLTLPDELAEVERAVNASESDLRQALHAAYIWRGPMWLRAVRLGVSESTLRRRISRAEIAVNRLITGACG